MRESARKRERFEKGERDGQGRVGHGGLVAGASTGKNGGYGGEGT